MDKKYHTVYLTIIAVLVVTLGWSFIFRQYDSPDVEPLPKIVIVPFFGPTNASIRLTNGVFHELEGSPAVKVEPRLNLRQPDFGNVNIPILIPALFVEHEDSLLLLGTVSGSDENLQISVQVWDNRPNGEIWTDQIVANIYDLDYIAEEIAGQVLSIASR